MKKNISMLVFTMALFGIVATVTNISTDIQRVSNISLILSICILQLIKQITKLNTRVLTMIQLLAVIAAMVYGFTGLEYLLPILIFELLGNKINALTCIFISLFLTVITIRENIFNIAIYNVISYLYLYEVKKQYMDNEELKEFNKGQRYERHLMEQKIANLERYLKQNNVTVSLRERNFMSQKIHDHLGHRITSSLMQLEVTKEIMDKDNEVSKKYLVSAMENLREGMDEIREVLRNIKPRDKVMGIEDIREELLKFQYQCNIKSNLKIEGDTERIRLNIWMVIQENLKEALTNVAKHSGATEVNVSVFVYNKIARIEVRDNGKGCKDIKSGLGLRGIEQRMQGIGGRVDYSNNKGFIINMMINLK